MSLKSLQSAHAFSVAYCKKSLRKEIQEKIHSLARKHKICREGLEEIWQTFNWDLQQSQGDTSIKRMAQEESKREWRRRSRRYSTRRGRKQIPLTWSVSTKLRWIRKNRGLAISCNNQGHNSDDQPGIPRHSNHIMTVQGYPGDSVGMWSVVHRLPKSLCGQGESPTCTTQETGLSEI